MRLREGLCRLDLPTNIPVGTVNVYVFTDEPVTIVDVGPKNEDCHAELKRQLHEVGLAPADIERIVLTHGHVDHSGLVETVRKESGAEVLAPEADGPMVSDYTRAFKERHERYREAALQAEGPDGQRPRAGIHDLDLQDGEGLATVERHAQAQLRPAARGRRRETQRQPRT